MVDRLWTELNVDPTARNEMRGLMIEAMERWRDRDTRIGRDQMLVVFVDDLDRCTPENVFQVFEAMKLYLEAPGLVFVVGFDAGIVSDALLHEKHFSKEMTGDRYLEKLIQVRYRIPPTSDQHAQKLILGYMAASGTQSLFDDAAQTLVIERNTRNPRRIKRFINSFILEYRIDSGWRDLGAEVLVRALILYFYFPKFARLLERPSNREPVGEFLTYVRVRDQLRRPAPGEAGARADAEVDAAFESYGLAPPRHDEARQEALKRIEAELPEEMVPLAGERELVSLLLGLGDREVVLRLGAKLQRRGVSPHATPVSDGATMAQPAPSSSHDDPVLREVLGLRVLWIDDESSNDEILAALQGQLPNLAVEFASDYSEARMMVAAAWPHLIISDIHRHGNDRAGFDDLELLRREDGYSGPAIFFTGRVTGARRSAARKLGADITNSPSELAAFVATVAGAIDSPPTQW